MVEQNARRCLQVCDRGYVLDQGRNAYTGTGRELLADPKVIELYLGTARPRRRFAARPRSSLEPRGRPRLDDDRSRIRRRATAARIGRRRARALGPGSPIQCSGVGVADHLPASKSSPRALPMLPSLP